MTWKNFLINRLRKNFKLDKKGKRALAGLPKRRLDVELLEDRVVPAFQVTSTAVLAGDNGFLLTFDAPYKLNSSSTGFNLYTGDSGGTLNPNRAVQITGPNGATFGVPGASDNLSFNAVPVNSTQLELLETGINHTVAPSLLASGTWNLTLLGGNNNPGIVQLSNNAALNGSGSGTVQASDNYSTSVTATAPNASTAAIVTIGDVVGGPGQTVTAPLLLSGNVSNVTSVSFQFPTNNSDFTVTGVSFTNAIAGDSGTFSASTGQGSFGGSVAFAGSNSNPVLIGTVSFQIPGLGNAGTAQPIGTMTPIGFTATGVANASGAVPYTGVDGFQLTAYPGDLIGIMGQYDSTDISQLQALITQSAKALAAYPNLDPKVIADVTHTGGLNSADVAQLQARIVNATSVIPALPDGATASAPTVALDPYTYIDATGITANPGQTGNISVPIYVLNNSTGPIVIAGCDYAVEFNPAELTFEGLTLGSIADGALDQTNGSPAGTFSAASFVNGGTTNPNLSTLLVTASTAAGSGAVVAAGQTATILYLNFHVNTGAAVGNTALNLLNDNGFTDLSDGTNTLVLNPAPSDAIQVGTEGQVGDEDTNVAITSPAVTLYFPTNFTVHAGQTVSVPLYLSTASTAFTVAGVDMAFLYDPSLLTFATPAVTAGQVANGSLFQDYPTDTVPAGSFAIASFAQSNGVPNQNVLLATGSTAAGSGGIVPANTTVTVYYLNFTVSSSVTPGEVIPLNLASDSQFTYVTDGTNQIPITPYPTDASNDAGVDGTLVVAAATPPALLLNAPSANYATSFTQLGGPVPVVGTNTLTLTDTSSPTIQSATVTIFNPEDGANEVLAANTTGTNITAAYNPSTYTLSLTGTDTIANYQQVLRTVTYNDTTTNNIGTNTRAIIFEVYDGINNSAPVDTTVSIVLHPDQPPHLTFPAAGSLSPILFNPANITGLNTGTPNTEAISGFVVADSDAGSGTETVTLSLTGSFSGPSGTVPGPGILTVSTSGGAAVTNNGSALVTINGTLTELDAALASLVYQPGPGFYGTATVNVLANDNGNTGYTGGLAGLMTSASTTVSVVGLFLSEINLTTPGTTTLTATGGTQTAANGGTATITVSGTALPAVGQTVALNFPATSALDGNFIVSGISTTNHTFSFKETASFTTPGAGTVTYTPNAGNTSEYLEIYSTVPSYTIPSGVYVVGINGEQATLSTNTTGTTPAVGTVQDIVNLSGFITGSNGFLVLLEKGSPFLNSSVQNNNGNTAANTSSTGSGFGNATSSTVSSTYFGVSGIHSGAVQSATANFSTLVSSGRLESVNDLEQGSVSYLLIQTATAPLIGNSIDSGNSTSTATVAGGSVYAGWNVMDGVAILRNANGPSATPDRSYAPVTFVPSGATTGTTIAGSETIATGAYTPSYIARLAESTRQADSDPNVWLASQLTGSGSTYTLGTNSTQFAGQSLNSVSGPNYLAPEQTYVVNDGSAQHSQVSDLLISYNEPVSIADLTSDFKVVDSSNNPLPIIVTDSNGVNNLSGDVDSIVGLSETGNAVTVTLQPLTGLGTPTDYTVGETVLMVGITDQSSNPIPGYDGEVVITSVAADGYSFTFNSVNTGLPTVTPTSSGTPGTDNVIGTTNSFATSPVSDTGVTGVTITFVAVNVQGSSSDAFVYATGQADALGNYYGLKDGNYFLQTVAADITNNGVALDGAHNGLGGSTTSSNIASATANASGLVTITTAHSIAMVAGQQITISGVQVSGSTSNPYNGTFTILSVTQGTNGTTFTYQAATVPTAPGTANTGTGASPTYQIDEFYRLFGDSNGDRSVDGLDTATLQLAYAYNAANPGMIDTNPAYWFMDYLQNNLTSASEIVANTNAYVARLNHHLFA